MSQDTTSNMDHQDQRKRAFSQAFQRINQPRPADMIAQPTKRMLTYPLGSNVADPDCDQENSVSFDFDCNTAFDHIPETQVRHHPLVLGARYENPAPYNYVPFQHQWYGGGSGPGLLVPPTVSVRDFRDTVLRESAEPSPEIVTGRSMFGRSPYSRPDSDAQPECGSGHTIYEDGNSPMSDGSTAVGPLTPSALNLGDLSLSSLGHSPSFHPVRADGYENHRMTIRFVPKSSFRSIYPEIGPNDVIVLFNKGRETWKVDRYQLCGSSRVFSELLDGPFLIPSLTRCIRLRNDFPYAISSMLHFIKTGNYECVPQMLARYPLLTPLDFHVHAYLVSNKYGIALLQDRALNAYLNAAAYEIRAGLVILRGGQDPDREGPLPEGIEGKPIMPPIDCFLNSLVLLWKHTHDRSDSMRRAVLEIIKRNLNELLRVPFFFTLMTTMVAFGDDVVASLEDDGFDVKPFQIPTGGRLKHVLWFDS